MKRRSSIKAVGAEFSVVSKAFIVFVAFSVETDGNKTVEDRMFLGLFASSNPGVPVVIWGVEKDEPGRKNIEKNICLHKNKILMICMCLVWWFSVCFSALWLSQMERIFPKNFITHFWD